MYQTELAVVFILVKVVLEIILRLAVCSDGTSLLSCILAGAAPPHGNLPVFKENPDGSSNHCERLFFVEKPCSFSCSFRPDKCGSLWSLAISGFFTSEN